MGGWFDGGDDASFVRRGGNAEAKQNTVPVLLDQVKVPGHGGVLGEDPDTPARVGQDRLEASPAEVVLLYLGRSGVNNGAKLDHTAFLCAAGIAGHPFRSRGVDNRVTVFKGIQAEGLEARMHAEQRARTAVRTSGLPKTCEGLIG